MSGAESVSFFQDDGYRIAADIYEVPGGSGSGVVMCHGWGGTKQIVAPTLAAELQSRFACTVLAFDYSGFGESEGPRARLDPIREVRDIRCAVSYMLGRFPHFKDHLGLYGFSFGGGISTYAAATDPRVTALLGVSGFSNGDRLMKDIRPLWKYKQFKDAIEEDRLARAVSGKSEHVDPDWILERDPIAKKFNEELNAQFPERRYELDKTTAELVCEFDAESVAHLLIGRPAKWVHTELDVLCSPQYSKDLARIAQGEIAILNGFGHYDIYAGDGLKAVSDEAAKFFSKHL